MQYGELALNYNGGNEMLAIKNSDDDIATFSSDTVWQAYHDNVERVVGEALNDLHSTKLDKDEAAETYVSDEYYTHTDNNYTTEEKNKLEGIAVGAEVNVQSDWNVTDSTSDAYIANKPTNVSTFTNDAGYTTNVGTITGITMNNTSKGTSGVVDLGTVITSVDDVFGKVYYDSSSKHINFYGKDDTSMTTVLGYVDATNFIKDGMIDSVSIGNATVDGQTVECLIITFNTDAGKSPINIPLSDIFDSGLYYTKSETDTLLAAKQNTLTFDSTPTSGSTNPVTSGGVYDKFADYSLIISSALNNLNDRLESVQSDVDAKQDTLEFDDYPIENSPNPVTSGGIYERLDYDSFVVASALNDLNDRKQDELVSGTNIKTVNGTTILGSGNIDADDVVMGKIDGVSFYEVASYNQDGTPTFSQTAATGSTDKIYLDILTNKLYWYDPTVVAVGESHYEQVGGSDITIDGELDDESTNPVENQAVSNYINEIERVTAESLNDLNDRKQDVLVSGTSLKTINDNSLLGSGNITIDGGNLFYTGADGDSISSGDTLNEAIEYLDTNKVRYKSYNNKTAMDTDSGSVNGTIGYDGFNEEFYIWNTDSGEWLKLGGEPLVETTYSDLLTLKSNSKLVPGVRYRITDFVTTTKTANTQSAGHPFDVIVLALSQNKLADEARAIQHEGDTYFSSSRLEAWKIWYSTEETSSSSLCDWSVLPSNGGKGTIYRMIDEWGNDCPYDFKNIQFKRKMTGSEYDPTSGTDTWVYTFCSRSFADASKITTLDVYKNVMGIYLPSTNKRALNNIVYLGVTFCATNQIGDYCYNCTFGDNTYDTVIGNSCNNITLGSYGNSISVGVGCSNIEVCPYTMNITIETGVDNTTISTSATGADSRNKLRNITVKNGVSGATISHPTLMDNFNTTYQPANSQVVSV